MKSKLYIIAYEVYWFKIVYTSQPFNLYDHYSINVLPFTPNIFLTIHNATEQMLNTLIELLESHYSINLHINEFNKFFFVPQEAFVFNTLINFSEANRSNTQQLLGFITMNNNSDIVYNTNNMNVVQPVSINTNNTFVPNASNTTLDSINTNVTPAANDKLPIDKLNYIKSKNLALFIWLDKFIRIDANAYTIKKDAFNHYKAFAKSQMLPDLKLQEFYTMINEIGFDDVRKDNNSVFDLMKIINI